MIEGQSERLDALEGRQGELQRALDLANHLAKREQAEASAKTRSKDEKPRKKRESFGPPSSRSFRSSRRSSSSTRPIRPEAELVLGWIGELYAIDDEAEGDLERLAELRRARSREVSTRIFAYLGTLEVLQSTSIGEAARYAYGNRKMLERFLDDPRTPLDNNRTERALRGLVVGCRNHFGSKSERGTQVAAIFYSLLETANLVGVNPVEYLREAVLAARAGRVLLPGDFANV